MPQRRRTGGVFVHLVTTTITLSVLSTAAALTAVTPQTPAVVWLLALASRSDLKKQYILNGQKGDSKPFLAVFERKKTRSADKQQRDKDGELT